MDKRNAGFFIILLFLFLHLYATPAYGSSPKFVQVSAAGQDCLALAEDGSVWEWGSNWRGELTGNRGDGPQAPIHVPITGVVAISAGSFQNVALRSDGTVWAWGCLGGNLSNATFMPVQVPISDVKSIYSGDSWCFAVKNDGTVWAWGNNHYGQLGDGSYNSTSTPVRVLLSNVSYIDASGVFAVDNDGNVWAWGNNVYQQWGDTYYYGRLGDHLTDKYYSEPVKLSGLHNVSSISGGSFHVLVLGDNGSLLAWGGNDKGQLGNGDLFYEPATYEQVPVFSNIDNVKAVAAGTEDSIALRNDGTVWAWGLEENHTVNPSPVQVPGLSDVTAISAGYTHYMALKSDGTVWVFGSVGRGQAGKALDEDYLYTPTRMDIDFSVPEITISPTKNNNSVTISQAPAVSSEISGNQTVGDNRTITPLQNTLNMIDIRISGIIGLILLIGCVIYLIKRK